MRKTKKIAKQKISKQKFQHKLKTKIKNVKFGKINITKKLTNYAISSPVGT